MSIESRQRLFRVRDGDAGDKVLPIELFFDLVFVFAVTQLSHRLVEHLTFHGALEALILFGAVWWLWVYTSWATNWLDPARNLVRGMLIAMMLGGLVLAVSIPKAFETLALPFAATYVSMQLGRTLLIAWAARGHNPGRVRNFLRIAFYFVLSGPLWIAGAVLPEWRIELWIAALAVEYAGPGLFFRTPFIGRSTSADWDISGAHMAERCALFIIIALGETILITGATYAKLAPDTATTMAFATSFLGSAVMWWIYFDEGARRAGEAIEDETTDTGRLARSAYTYLHMPIVAGIIVTAVADEMMLAHPVGHHAEMPFILAACGGPFLFLIGNQGFKWITAEYAMPPLSHFVGMALLIGIGVLALHAHWSPLATGTAATGALVVTAVWEWLALHGGWRRWAPWLGRRTAIALEESER